MDDTYISRMEHEEFCKRIEGEDKRQNKRLDNLEESMDKLTATITTLTNSTISSLASSTKP